MLTDSFGRIHTYLRISLTDHCNLRCFYCMPDESMQFMPNAHLMQADEVIGIARVFVAHGVNKIRLTGGEPTVRKDFPQIVESLSALPVELTLTTNGIRIHEYIDLLKTAGVRSLNVSIDTLKREKFHRITGRDQFEQVWRNILLLLEQGFHVKLNAVAMEGVNDDEILDMVALTEKYPLHVRFIEFMPFTGNHWENARVLPFDRMLKTIAERYAFYSLVNGVHDTAKKFRVNNFPGTFAVISTMSEPFCSGCNRLRLTADGKMKNCLFSKGESDILSAYRNREDITPVVLQNLAGKAWERGGQIPHAINEVDAHRIENRTMISIGG